METIEKRFLIEEYKSRINKAIDFIDANLDKNITLSDIADAANFSKFHFNRIFLGMMGETPFEYIGRIRIEKAAAFLIYNPKKSITEIAFDCGFSDSAVFARKFKLRFGLSATKYRKQKTIFANSNYNQTHDKRGKADYNALFYLNDSFLNNNRSVMKVQCKEAAVKKLSPLNVVYVRHIGPYKGDVKLFERLFEKLFKWAGPRGLTSQKDLKTIIVYHDDPEVAKPEDLRISVCMTAPALTEVDGEVGKMEIAGGEYLVARFEIKSNEFQYAWNWIFSEWMPSSGYQCDDNPCFEMYTEECAGDICKVDICVPVKPL